MIRTRTFFVLALLALAGACAPADTPAPVVVPSGEDRYLIDPRIGYTGPVPEGVDERFDNAWRWALAGEEAEARRRLDEILRRNPEYLPAALAVAAIDLRAGRIAEARATVDAIRQRDDAYLAARTYEAEIATREGRIREAAELFREIAAAPAAPVVANERLLQLETTLFEKLYAEAQAAPDAEAVRLLREALTIRPDALEPRILLAQKLTAQRQFDEARRELDPLLNTAADRTEVQELLAEIDFGRGRYEEAIARYERLARRTRDQRYQQRLDVIKREWSAANMPAHFRAALGSTSLSRAEFATLLFWTVPSVRFAQNLGTPPIAVDIQDVAGREEIIRAIALGLYDVDPVTRRVSPYRPVTASRLLQHVVRTLVLRGASCARGVPQEQVLAACGVQHSLVPSDEPVTGEQAHALLQQIARML